MNEPRSHTLPKEFLTAYDPNSGVEVFEDCYTGILHRLAQVLNVWVCTILSTRCFHQWGGAKMMLRELRAWMKPGDFVFKATKRRYAQGGHRFLHEYLKRWRTWVHAGLPFPVYHVEEIIEEIRASVTNSKHQWNSQSTTHIPTRSVPYGLNRNRKGKMPCINQNFSGHY